jgi:hypothetical protein
MTAHELLERLQMVAREAGAMGNQTYREINKVDTLAASKALRRLRDAGLFTQKDRGSATWYQLTARMLGRNDQDGGKDGAAPSAGELTARGAGGAGLSSNPLSLSSNPGALSSNLGSQDSNPRQPEARDDPLADPSRQAVLNELPGGRHRPAPPAAGGARPGGGALRTAPLAGRGARGSAGPQCRDRAPELPAPPAARRPDRHDPARQTQ